MGVGFWDLGFLELKNPGRTRLWNPTLRQTKGGARALAPKEARTGSCLAALTPGSSAFAETPVLASWEPDNLLRNSWGKLKKHLAAAGFALALLIGPKSGIGLENIVERFRNRDKV